MADTTTKTPEKTNVDYKEIALRSQRIRDLETVKATSPQDEKTATAWKCLSCLWLHDCNSQCQGGCEEFEKSLTA